MKKSELMIGAVKKVAKLNCENSPDKDMDYWEKGFLECGKCLTCQARKVVVNIQLEKEMRERARISPNGEFTTSFCSCGATTGYSPDGDIDKAEYTLVCPKCVWSDVEEN